jgi:uncharacterized protein YxjI
MNFPVDLTFKHFALASQIYVRDASGNLMGYVKQKLFKLKEDINVFTDESQTAVIYNIKADRVIDFSARYTFRDGTGNVIGAIKRKGMRSMWKANYEITDANDQHIMTVHEENGWVKVVDAFVGELPIIGMFTGYFFNPSYILSRVDGAPLARLAKQPAFLEGKFQITPQAQLSSQEEVQVLLGFLMMTLLERRRG